MEIRDIVKDWLEKNGYGGLFNGSGDCACATNDLMPCDYPCLDCEAGYVTEAVGDDGEKGVYSIKTLWRCAHERA